MSACATLSSYVSSSSPRSSNSLIAAAHELDIEVTLRAGYSATLNDTAATAAVREVVHDLFGAKAFLELSEPIMAAEDFSYVLRRMPGCMVFLGTTAPDTTAIHACHSNRMTIDESTLARGIALHGAVAERYLAGI